MAQSRRMLYLFGCLIAVATVEGTQEALLLAGPVQLQPLNVSLGRFTLTGGKTASLSEINGGGLCVGPMGMEPPAWVMTGKVSLRQCSEIAMQQPNAIGFRWGREGFSYENFEASIVSKEDSPELKDLFTGADLDFTCSVYVQNDADGTIGFTVDISALKMSAELSENQGWNWREICYQRWTVGEFFVTSIPSLWFCYMPNDRLPICKEKGNSFRMQGAIFLIILIAFLGLLGWIMGATPEFRPTVVWFSRGMVCFMMAVYFSEMLMLTSFGMTSSWIVFAFVIVLLTFFVTHLIVFPGFLFFYMKMNSLSMFWFLTLCFAPCVFFELTASYFPSFAMVIDKLPVVTAIVAFCVMFFVDYAYGALCASKN